LVTAGYLELLRLGQEFIRAINHGERDQIARYPGVITKAISSKSTNAEALREMEKSNLEALVVVDDGRFKGVVEREQLLSRMMLALA
jgi:predicted transcriptional regulator